MDHKTGDYVVHPAYGVGQIVAIEEMEFVEKKQSLFYRVGFGKTTIWIPVQVEEGGIRPLTTKEDLANCRRILESPPESLDVDFRKRQNDLEKRLEKCSFKILCEVVRDLSALRHEKVLNNYEKNLLQKISRSLHQEWAAASGIPMEETSQIINAMLQKGSNK